MQLAFAFSKICMKIENYLHANKESCSYTLVAVFESVDSIAKISFCFGFYCSIQDSIVARTVLHLFILAC